MIQIRCLMSPTTTFARTRSRMYAYIVYCILYIVCCLSCILVHVSPALLTMPTIPALQPQTADSTVFAAGVPPKHCRLRLRRRLPRSPSPGRRALSGGRRSRRLSAGTALTAPLASAFSGTEPSTPSCEVRVLPILRNLSA